MKQLSTKVLAALIAFCLVTTINTSNATIRRVGFTATAKVPGVDYATLQLAHDSANIGDTIQIYPATPNSSYTCTVNKKLVFIGTGYFTSGGFNQNNNLQNIVGSCEVTVTLDTGATGSVFEGIGTSQMTGNDNFYYPKALNVSCIQFSSVNNINFKRCFIGNVTMANYAPNDSWTFVNCFGSNQIASTSINSNIPTNGGVAITNLRIENCIGFIVNFQNSPNGTILNGTMKNCIFIYSYNYGADLNNGSFLIQNCIFPPDYNGYTYLKSLNNATNCVFQNNITSDAQSGSVMNTAGSSGNKFGVSFSASGGNTTNFNTVFVGYPYNTNTSGAYVYSLDGKFQLKTGSTAIGAGVGGVDCGIYGGTAPYKLSGIPSTPTFYKLSATSSTATSSPYTITFSVRSNN